MKRIFLAMLAAALFVTPAFCIDPEEQNAGFLDFAQPVQTIRPDAITYIYREAPASDTTWLAEHPNCSYVVLPRNCSGFQINVSSNDVIIGHPADLATGDVFVGIKIAAGSSFEWNGLDIDQKTIYFGMLSNGTDNATATFCGW